MLILRRCACQDERKKSKYLSARVGLDFFSHHEKRHKLSTAETAVQAKNAELKHATDPTTTSFLSLSLQPSRPIFPSSRGSSSCKPTQNVPSVVLDLYTKLEIYVAYLRNVLICSSSTHRFFSGMSVLASKPGSLTIQEN